MKSLRLTRLSAGIILATCGIAQGQTPPPTVESYLAAAKAAARTMELSTPYPGVTPPYIRWQRAGRDDCQRHRGDE
jgi:hypothetical protein